ncbi:MAG: ShlB/FhaC/HecB family hemolysin secretion/activation protein [Desulfuromonadaceae bacterium]
MQKIAMCLLLLLVFCSTASAQPATVEQKSPSDALPQPDMLSLRSKIHVKKFKFTGNTVFSSDELSKLAFPYENREIVFEELEKLRQELSLHYANKGYVNSGILIPDQKVDDGTITLTVIEGTLNRIDVHGLKHFRTEYITIRLEKASEQPVNIGRLQEALQLLQQDARIKRINAEFKPGMKLGEGVLDVAIEEERPYLLALTFNNNAPPSTGSYRGEVNVAHQNLFGFGDILSAGFGITEGANDYNASYLIPLNSRDTSLELYSRKDDNTVTESQFSGLDIKSESDSYGLRVKHPIFKTPNKELALSLAAEARKSKTFLLGRRFSFSAGAVDGESKECVLRFSQEWLDRTPSTVMAFHSTFSVGIDALAATVHASEADGRFFSWLGQLLLIKKLGETDAQLVFRTDVQLANDSLLSLEKFSVGGMNSVRGYRKDLLVRDNGLNSSAEVRFPVLDEEKGFGLLQIVPFFDFGWAWDNKTETPDPKTIYSTGLGLKWEFIKKVYVDVFYGYGLKTIKDKGNDLQDQGVHFQLTWRVI